MRTLSILAAAATALISTVGVAQSAPRQFTRDGHTYVYTTSVNRAGKTVIEGRELGSATHFRLLVNGDRVSGQSNGYPVSFRAPAGVTATTLSAN